MKIRAMDTAPLNGSYVILVGDSGCTTTPFRFAACRYDKEYRPHQPWVDHANDSFLDEGGEPIGWLPLPEDEQYSAARTAMEGVKKASIVDIKGRIVETRKCQDYWCKKVATKIVVNPRTHGQDGCFCDHHAERYFKQVRRS